MFDPFGRAAALRKGEVHRNTRKGKGEEGGVMREWAGGSSSGNGSGGAYE